jgi:hypothetical protein
VTTLTLPRWGIPDWTTLARVITNELGVPFHANYQDDVRDALAGVIHIDLSTANRTRAVEVCDFYLSTHPEIRWNLT